MEASTSFAAPSHDDRGRLVGKAMVVLEFPTRRNAENFLADPEFQELAKIRHRTTTSKLVLVDGAE
jgi:uncharacterized protein (DUF1330 family)